MAADPVVFADRSEQTLSVEHGLARKLSERQMSMIAIGGAIGTGLFLGSALAVRTAGPAVILSYIFAALVALLLMYCLCEMAVAHPTAGSFGVYADLYLSPWAGFVVRYTYWAAQCIAIGGEAVAAGIYTQWWFPQTPAWIWVIVYSAVLVFVNARSVSAFGTFEYWFSMIKVSAIVVFILLGAAALLGIHQRRPIGLANFHDHGGFLPHGWTGVGLALSFVIFSFIGTEIVAVTAGEAEDPDRSVPRAMRSMLLRLAIFYIGSITILVGVIPWTQVQPGAGVTVSPFVRLFDVMHVPAAAHIVNFVVLTAALSGMNCNLYLATRMVFSLSRAGYAPARLGRVSETGIPIAALALSTFGLAVATAVAISFPGSAYVYLFGVSLFGALFVWLMIFITHLSFRKYRRRHRGRALPVHMPFFPVTTILGGLAVFGITVSTWWVEGMRVTIEAGVPWLIVLSAYYFAHRRWRARRIAAAVDRT